MREDERNLRFLRWVVEQIYGVIRRTEEHVAEKFPAITPCLPPDIQFVHSEELERRWPDLTPREREDKISREAGKCCRLSITRERNITNPTRGERTR